MLSIVLGTSCCNTGSGIVPVNHGGSSVAASSPPTSDAARGGAHGAGVLGVVVVVVHDVGGVHHV
jgi:hypothetical protein